MERDEEAFGEKINKEDFKVDDEMRELAEKITQGINNHIANAGKKVRDK